MCIYSTANICYCAYDQGEPRELLLPLKCLCHKCLGVSRGQNSKSMSMSFFDNDDGYHHLCILSALQNHCRHHQQQKTMIFSFNFFESFQSSECAARSLKIVVIKILVKNILLLFVSSHFHIFQSSTLCSHLSVPRWKSARGRNALAKITPARKIINSTRGSLCDRLGKKRI